MPKKADTKKVKATPTKTKSPATKKASAKKVVVKKSPAKKVAAKKAPTKKVSAKKEINSHFFISRKERREVHECSNEKTFSCSIN